MPRRAAPARDKRPPEVARTLGRTEAVLRPRRAHAQRGGPGRGAAEEGAAPKIKLASTHRRALKVVPLKILMQHAVEDERR